MRLQHIQHLSAYQESWLPLIQCHRIPSRDLSALYCLRVPELQREKDTCASEVAAQYAYDYSCSKVYELLIEENGARQQSILWPFRTGKENRNSACSIRNCHSAISTFKEHLNKYGNKKVNLQPSRQSLLNTDGDIYAGC